VAEAAWPTEAAIKAEPRIVRIVFFIGDLPFLTLFCEAKAPRISTLVVQITIRHDDYHRLADHKTASKFLGQRVFWIKYSADERAELLSARNNKVDGLFLTDPVEWRPTSARLSREADEEAYICNSPDRVTGMGANQVATEEPDRTGRPVCAHWPNRGWQAGLFDEMR
jgi:hypothetical protein